MRRNVLSSRGMSRRSLVQSAGVAGLGTMIPLVSRAQDMASPAASPESDLGYIPSPMEGVPDAWYRYPEAPQASVSEAPGTGGTVKMVQISDKHIKARDENQWWQELEKRLGTSVEITLVPGAAYGERMATMIAGGDFPDLLSLYELFYPQFTEFMLQGAFTDVMPYLNADARGEYPNLAAFPDYSYRSATLNGAMYGVPSPVSLQGNFMYYRQDWLETVGAAVPTNADEFMALLDAFTNGDPNGDGSADTYGTAFERLDPSSQRFVHGMFRVGAESDGWVVQDDGTWLGSIETEEFRQALQYSQDLWSAKVAHPDSMTQTSNEIREQLMAGKVGSGPNHYINLPLIRTEAAKVTPEATFGYVIPPGHDGGAGVTYNPGGYFGMWAIPSPSGQDEGRLQELLRITNYLAAPFGSEEFTFLQYGIEGVHHNVEDSGARVLTEAGEQEIVGLGLGGLNMLYNPDREAAREVQDMMHEHVKLGVFAPTEGLYSQTAAEKSGELNQFYFDNKIAICTGQKSVADLDTWISDWKSRGGDQIRKEYEEAWAASQQ